MAASSRVSGYWVVMDKDIAPDQAEATRKALCQIKGVLTVEPKTNHSFEELTIRHRLIDEITGGIGAILTKARNPA